MIKLKRISGRELCKILIKLGFIMVHGKGSHVRFRHPDGRRTVVPVHGNEELGKGLFLEILKQMRITKEEFARLIE